MTLRKMKKTLLLITAAFLCIQIQAQIVSSRSVGITTTEKQPSETLWYLRAGANFMSMTGDGAEDLDSKLGYDVSWGFHNPIGRNNFYWGMEFGLGSRGFKYEDSESEGNYAYKIEESLVAHNLHFSPINLGWKYGITNEIKIDLHAGLFASFDYVGKFKLKASETYRGETETWDESYSMGDWEDELGLEWNRFDIGANLGFGVWYNNFNLDFSFKRGFMEVAKDSEMNSSNFMIRLGIAF